MTPDRLDEIATRLAAAHRGAKPVAWQTTAEGLELADAYGLQDRVRDMLDAGARATAWKVSPPRAGSASVAAPVPNACCVASPARLAATDFSMLGVEVEIAFRFGRDLPRRAGHHPQHPVRDAAQVRDAAEVLEAAEVREAAGAFDAAEVLDAVDTLLVALELCDTRLAAWRDAPPLWKLADFQSSGALVIGTAVRDWVGIDFGSLLAQLVVNGEVRAEARGSHPSGDPSVLLPWLAGHVAQRCGGLRRGDVVTTGTWTGMHFVAPGDVVEARFPGLGEARLQLVA
ncbi:MAG: fumarylacetoacetate hydrolase family protein [Burkholderiales bacterium]|nr:MAG: fumarylacetoacetate hydrolase family protein [Burkholderiales bacterium]